MQFDLPITTIEEAKRYFNRWGVLNFHMGREDPTVMKSIANSASAKDQERKWAAEEIAAKIAQLNRHDTDKAALPDGFSTSKTSWQIGSSITSWRRFFEHFTRFAESLPPSDEVLVARTIIGATLSGLPDFGSESQCRTSGTCQGVR